MTTPTPSSRACARLLALLAVVSVYSAPPAAAAPRRAAGVKQEAAVEWVKVEYTHNGVPYTYYYPKNAPYTNDAGHERINLYKEPRLEDAFMARSHLYRKPGDKDKSFNLHLITESEKGAASDLVKAAKNWKQSPHKLAAQPPPAPAAPAPVAAQPAPAGPAPAGPAPNAPVRKPDAPADITNGVPVGAVGGPVVELREAMKQGERWEDVAKRIIPWAWAEGENGRSFITPDARKNTNTEPAFRAAMTEVIKDAAHWASAISVYYIVGPGEPVPAWVAQDPKLKKLLVDDQVAVQKDKLPEVLAQCLDRWRHNPTNKIPEKCDKQLDRGQVRTPYPAKDLATWPRDFLVDAGREAIALREAIRVGTGAISGATGNAPSTVGDAPGGPGTRPTRLPAVPTAEFGVEHLFGKWGDPNVIHLDGRLIAVTLRTQQTFEGDPPRAVMRQQIGLYDISSPADIYGRRIEIANSGEQVIDLKPGGKSYKVSFVPDGNDTKIVIERPDGTKPEFGGGQKELPSISGLFQARAQQALDSGNRISIGGTVYRVTAESGSTGNLVFWDEEKLKKDAAAISGGFAGFSARSWQPSMMAEVVQMRGGQIVPVSKSVPLGKEVNGKWQGLRWDESSSVWVPAEGDEFKPKAPAPPTTPGGPTGGTPPTGPGGTNPPPGSSRPGTAAKLNALLADDVKGVTGFLDTEGKLFGQHLIVTRLKSDGSPADGRMTHPTYMGLSEGRGVAVIDETIIAGRWLQTKSEKGYVFWDLKNFDLVKDGGGLKVLGLAGEFSLADGIKGIKDRAVLSVVLKLAGYTGDEAKILANLDAAAKGSSNWVVAGHAKSTAERISVVVDDHNCTNLWPKLIPGDCAGATDQSPSTVPGAGNGLALDGGANMQYDAALPFGEEWQNSEGVKAARVDPKPASAALYQGADGERKLWYLSFIAAGDEGKKVKRMPSLVFSDKKEGATGLRYPKKAVTISGLVVKGNPDQSYSLRAVMGGDGTLEDSGFIGAYTSSTNDSCVGVVASWGITHQAACTKCGAKWEGGVCKSTK